MSSLPPLHHHPFYTFLAQAQRFNQMSMFSPISSIKGSYHPASIPSSIDPTKMMTPKVNSESARPLIEWFDAHLSFPYPSYEDMKHLKQMTGFSDTQVRFLNNLFVELKALISHYRSLVLYINLIKLSIFSLVIGFEIDVVITKRKMETYLGRFHQ